MSQMIKKPTDEKTKSNDGAGGTQWTSVAGALVSIQKTSSGGYNALRGFSRAEQEAIQAGVSTADHSATLDEMLSTEKHLYLPRGTWRRSTKWGVTSGLHVEGAGAGLTILKAIADVELIELTGEFVHVHGMRLAKTGAHTKNLLNIGTAAGARADRAHINDLIVTGAGEDGICLYAGNLGTLSSIRSRANGRDGFNFDRSASPDSNAWVFSGFIDSSNNGRDGFRLEDGISLADGYASRHHSGGLLVAQGNAGWGVYVGTGRNDLSIYAESNGAGQVYLGQFAQGNNLTVGEGVVVGNVGGVAGSLDGNNIKQLNHNANFRAGFKSKVEVSGGAGRGYRIAGDDGTAGFFDFEKTAAREIRFKYAGSGGAWNHYHEHTTAGIEAAQWYGGRLIPISTSTWDFGTSSFRWKDIYAETVRLGLGNRGISTGSGSPEGVVAASPGALYLNTGGGTAQTLWVKESGNSTSNGWVAK